MYSGLFFGSKGNTTDWLITKWLKYNRGFYLKLI